jgi:ABC-type multidrug transport system ATPase subunit
MEVPRALPSERLQLKRVNIGLELVADPTILFLDEPTSGLDATASFEILEALRSLSRLGMTVVTVIHQPRFSIFSMFDTVLLLGVGGRTVFCGPAEYAIGYSHPHPPWFRRLREAAGDCLVIAH